MQFDGTTFYDRDGNKRYTYTKLANYYVDIYEHQDKKTQETTYEEILYYLENFIWIPSSKYTGYEITIVPYNKQYRLQKRKSRDEQWEMLMQSDYSNCKGCGQTMILENGCRYINTCGISLLKPPFGLISSLQEFGRKYEE